MTLSTLELSTMRADQADYFHDTCKIGTATEAQGANGEVTTTWAYGAATACGLQMTGGRERKRSDGTVLVVDATLRLPIGTTIDAKSRVQITKRHGTALASPLYFMVVGYPKQGPSALVVDLEEIG
jgi:hypothetical protein